MPPDTHVIWRTRPLLRAGIFPWTIFRQALTLFPLTPTRLRLTPSRLRLKELVRCLCSGAVVLVVWLLLPAMAWGQLALPPASPEPVGATLPDAPTPQGAIQPDDSSLAQNTTPSQHPGQDQGKPQGVAQQRAQIPPSKVHARTTPVSDAVVSGMLPAGRLPCGIDDTWAFSPLVAIPGAIQTGETLVPTPTAVLPPCIPPARGPLARFLSTSFPDDLTGRKKLIQAGRDIIDPFNLITIVGLSSLYVMENAHSDYGPGMLGVAKNSGVSFTQNMTGEFVGVFLLPALMREDPRYHRMPMATFPQRIGHALIQTLITQGDNGRPMFNYSNFPGMLIEDEISNLYVPMRHTNLASTTARVAIGLATVPIGNFITEFMPDIARHINFKVVFLQRIINQVTVRDGTQND